MEQVRWGREGGEREGKLMLIAGVETLLDKAAFPWLGNGGEWLLLALYCVLLVSLACSLFAGVYCKDTRPTLPSTVSDSQAHSSPHCFHHQFTIIIKRR